MVTDKRPFRLQGNLIENNLRLGIAGFLIGACLSLAVVFLFFIGKTVLTTRDMTRTYSAENYYILLDDFFRVYYLNPAAAVDMILVETEYNPNQLDQAEGLTQIALAYRMMGYEQKALDTYQRILDSMQDCLYRNAYSDRQAFILAHAILAADNLKESLLADQLYVRLKGQVASTLDEIQDSKSVSDSYWYLIKTVSRREGTLAAREYFQQMQNRIEPQLEWLHNISEIGPAYTRLTNAAVELDDSFRAEQYQEELIQILTPMLLDESVDPDQLRLIHRYLGFAEEFLGKHSLAASHFQIVVKHNPSPSNIYLLANTYSSAGMNECSYFWFSELVDMEDPAANIYRAASKNALFYFEQSDVICTSASCCPEGK